MQTTTQRSITIRTVELLPGNEFSDSQSFSRYTHLPVLQLRDEFSLAELHLGGTAGTGSLMTTDGPVGTLRIQIGARQAYVLINLTDEEVIDALTAWHKAGFVPVSVSFDGNEALAGARTPPEFGQRVLAQGRHQPMTAEVFVEHAMESIGSGSLQERASSDIPAIQKLDRVTANLLATRKVRRAAEARYERV